MWRHYPPHPDPVTGRSIAAGFLVAAGFVAVLVAVDYPTAAVTSLAVVMAGGLLVRRLRRARTLEIPGTRVGLQVTVSRSRDAAPTVAECSIALVDRDESSAEGRPG
ncbi:hypothetical protein [Natronorubrum tibetense]|uniref:Uncharacterized protein n=1 Tax=Natronorubrum tibetense GA33 TaxID=1114856 RepID=L9W3Q9_9EURY|nr:hypothetical protein [Natronorubrum tibetense]ELY44075.1 hypothetical protein C496_04665 [Natronorubrum tibetense GA33]